LAPAAPIDLAALEAPADAPIEERVARVTEVHETSRGADCPAEELTEDRDAYCVLGDPDGTTTLLVVGDSQLTPWRRSLDAIGRTNGIRVAVRQASPCRPFRVDGPDPERNPACRRIQEGHLRVFDRLDPDAVVVAAWSGGGASLRSNPEGGRDALDPAEQVEVWSTRSDAFYRAVLAGGASLGVILDPPTLPVDAGECLIAEGDADACTVPREDALARSGQLLQASRAVLDALDGAEVLDAG